MGKIMKILSTLITLSVTCLIMTSSMNVSAKGKPETPANTQATAKKQVCDVVKGGTPGLYGLCVSYCVAQDLPHELPTAESIAALTPPARSILTNYNNKKKDTDPAMPCLAAASEPKDEPVVVNNCLAWTNAELASIGATAGSTTYNDKGTGYFLYDAEKATAINPDRQAFLYAAVNYSTLNNQYIGTFKHSIKTDGALTLNVNRVTDLTFAEYEACKQAIVDHVI